MYKMYIWSRVPCSCPPNGMGPQGSPGSTPFPSICKLLAAFLRSSLVFANTYHPYNTNHSCHTYHTYHTYQTYHTFQTCHTRPTIHTIHIQHTIPHPHHTTGGGRGTVPHPHHTRGGGGQYHPPHHGGEGGHYYGWPMTMARGGGGLQRWTYIYIYPRIVGICKKTSKMPSKLKNNKNGVYRI